MPTLKHWRRRRLHIRIIQDSLHHDLNASGMSKNAGVTVYSAQRLVDVIMKPRHPVALLQKFYPPSSPVSPRAPEVELKSRRALCTGYANLSLVIIRGLVWEANGEPYAASSPARPLDMSCVCEQDNKSIPCVRYEVFCSAR